MVRATSITCRGAADAAPDMRSGFTLVESLVAVVMIACGLLALVSTGAVLVRDAGAAYSRERAAYTGLARLESLRALPCTAIGPGQTTSTAAGLSEAWASTPRPAATIELFDSVTYARSGRSSSVVLHTRSGC